MLARLVPHQKSVCHEITGIFPDPIPGYLHVMLHLLSALIGTLAAPVRSRGDLAIETLALRQQLAILKCKTPRPRLSKTDRAFWVLLQRWWHRWRDAVIIVKPDTVIGWHRKGFKLYWTWKSRRPLGRPKVDVEIRDLIRQMARDNPTWGAPRIHGELLKLDYAVSEPTVSRYMPRERRPPSQTWRTFLRNQACGLTAS